MGRLNRIFIIFIICIAAIASDANSDNAEIIKILHQLYAEPQNEFLYRNDKSIEYWKKKYEKYYNKQIVDLLLQYAQESSEPGPLRTWDPRFYPVDVDRLMKMRVVEICAKDDTKIALVVYKTTHYIDTNESVSQYYFKKTMDGWRICDQWYGKTIDKPWRTVSDLKYLIPNNRVNRLLDELMCLNGQ